MSSYGTIISRGGPVVVLGGCHNFHSWSSSFLAEAVVSLGAPIAFRCGVQVFIGRDAIIGGSQIVLDGALVSLGGA